jgi:hypothetical protein
MIGFKSGTSWSSSLGWETSFYGGYYRTLYDHAEIRINYNIDIILSKDSKLGYYTGMKLAKLLLHKINTYGLYSAFLNEHSVVEREERVWKKLSFTKVKKQYIVISPRSIDKCINTILLTDDELKNMLVYYIDELLKTSFEIKIKDKDDDDDKGSGEGDGKADKTKEGFDFELIKGLLQETTVLKPWTPKGSIGSGHIDPPTYKVPTTRKGSPLNNEDLIYANQLVEKLDITFDFDRDEIKSLKAGKLDINKIAEAVAGNERIYKRVEEDQKTKPFSVVILCDESGSMGGSKLQNQHRLVKILYTAFSEILPQDRISVYGHTGNYSPDVYVYQDRYNPTFTDTIDDMLYRDICENYDGPVIEALYNRIREHSDENILFIVISDGQPSGENYGGFEAVEELKRIIEKCKRDGFVTMGIGFAYDGVKEIYNYHTIIRDFKKMVEKVSVLVNKVVKTEFQ